jgi:hypothetical protein
VLVQAAAARWLDDVPDVLAAEALAAKEGLELAVENGYDRVVLEIDCRGLKTLLDDRACMRSPVGGRGLKTLLDDRACMRSSVGGIYSDITELGRSFIEFRVEWVHRDATSVAYYCARMVTATERSQFCFDYFPDWLSGLAAANCTPVF